MAQLDELPAPDYLVIHHVEQDHSGCTPLLLERFPELTVVCNEKARVMLIDHLHVDDARFQVVADGDTLSLGDKTLRFLFTPWVHWPETMRTWLEEDKVLFSCDFFGSHYATSDVFADKHEVYDGAKRYYAEIMMPFGGQVLKNVEQGDAVPDRRSSPQPRAGVRRPGVHHRGLPRLGRRRAAEHRLLPYVTMHDSTRLMVEHLTAALTDRGVAVERFDLTTLGRRQARHLAGRRRHAGPRHADRARRPAPAGRLRGGSGQRAQAARQYATVIGSYGWGGKTVETLVGHDAEAQARAPRAGARQGHAARRGLRARWTRSPTPSRRSTRTSRRGTSPTSRSAAPTTDDARRARPAAGGARPSRVRLRAAAGPFRAAVVE